jgi:ribosomal protein S8E
MTTEKEVSKKKNDVFKRWYGDNREEYNKRRKNRYDTDPEYREKVKERARLSKRRKIAAMGGAVTRSWKGTTLLVYRIGRVCEKLGINKNVILDWENRGIIPTPIFGGKHRVYTQNQMDLIRELYEEVKTANGDYKEVHMIENSRKLHIKSQWDSGL